MNNNKNKSLLVYTHNFLIHIKCNLLKLKFSRIILKNQKFCIIYEN